MSASVFIKFNTPNGFQSEASQLLVNLQIRRANGALGPGMRALSRCEFEPKSSPEVPQLLAQIRRRGSTRLSH